jgi:hypothetical protein
MTGADKQSTLFINKYNQVMVIEIFLHPKRKKMRIIYETIGSDCKSSSRPDAEANYGNAES